ncbi:type II methionyl aminopeptidase [Candidatus Pacearchaeota archaeon]|nr:type II methionyl aminopeptidase [Candidatus Pacearchaeota archaeon]
MELNQEAILKAGKIAQQVRAYSKTLVKPGVLLLEIAEKIEAKIEELGGKPAFPVNLSMNEIAAHSTPTYNDVQTAKGLLKVDFGVHIDGWVADTAETFNLDTNPLHQKLIDTAKEALKQALTNITPTTPLGSIGKKVNDTATHAGFQPIHNLSGHSITQHDLHAGLTIPNYDTGQSQPIGEGLCAIEPFMTSGVGRVREGRPSTIYSIAKEGNVRDPLAREILAFIEAHYRTLPFCARWLYKKFGTRALLALQRLEQAGILYQYPQLIEESGAPVAQAEHTILITKTKTIITTG